MTRSQLRSRAAAHDKAVRSAIGRNIRRAREELLERLGQGGVSMTEQRGIAASLLGQVEGRVMCSGGGWALYERGERLPTDGRMVRMATVLGIELRDLYDDIPTMEQASS